MKYSLIFMKYFSLRLQLIMTDHIPGHIKTKPAEGSCKHYDLFVY